MNNLYKMDNLHNFKLELYSLYIFWVCIYHNRQAKFLFTIVAISETYMMNGSDHLYGSIVGPKNLEFEGV